MWICFKNGFVSAVQDPKYPDQLMVRARRENHLKRIFGKGVKIYENEHRDYRFRTFVKKDVFARLVATEIESIDYTNFKDRVKKIDPELEGLYMKFWLEHLNYQERVYGQSYHGWGDYFHDRYERRSHDSVNEQQ